MHTGDWDQLERLFDEGIALAGAERSRWLEALKARDPAIAAILARMLAADEAAAADQDPIGVRIERQAELGAGRLQPGDRLGAWTVEGLLGRGGMGSVYLARRSDEAYRQRAVIKVVEAGAQARLARLFERERQILADLNHPGIARLLDGGELDDGRPFLVMEYVDGIDIVSYCEQAGLDLDERIELLIAVAQAVQFAHANRVIHRDIKPDNVMVDARGLVRLLDFGIAQLLEQPEPAPGIDPDVAAAPSMPAGLTLQDGLLSPAYASPEQLRGETITTASDIYSLGLLLYRMLSPGLPQRSGPIAPISSCLADGCRSARLRVQGADLDAILFKALADEPGDRHASVDALIEDLRRFLERQPVQARHAGRWQLMRLFAYRNPALSASLGLTVLLVSSFSLGLAALALALERERQRVAAAGAVTEQVASFMVDLFAAADPEIALGQSPSARDLLDRGARRIAELGSDPPLQASLAHRMAQAYRNLGVTDRADELMTMALNQASYLEPQQRHHLKLEQADLWRELGQGPAAAERLQTLIEELERQPHARQELARAYNNYGLVRALQGEPQEAEHWTRRALAVDLDGSPESRRLQVSFRHNLALQLGQQGRPREAIELLEGVLADKLELFGPLHPSYTRSLEVLAVRHRDLGELDRATQLLLSIRDIHAEVLGADSLAVARNDNELGAAFQDAGDYGSAERHYRMALAYSERHPEYDTMLLARVLNNLGTLLEDAGREAEALVYFRRSVALRETLLAPHDLALLSARNNLVRLLIRIGQLDEAGAELALLETLLSEHHPGQQRRIALTRLLRAEWLAASGAAEEAIRSADESWALLGEDSAAAPALSAGITALRVAQVLLKSGASESAGARLAAAERSLDHSTAPDHPARLLLALARAELLLLSGRHDEGQALLTTISEPLQQGFEPQSSHRQKLEALLRRTQ